MNFGISIETGQPVIHFAFLHFKQREASSFASSILYPKHTSSKFVALTLASCSLTGTFFNTSIICHLRIRNFHFYELLLHAVLKLLFLLLFYTSADVSLLHQNLPDVHQILVHLHRQISLHFLL